MRAKGDRAVGEIVTELDGTEMQQCLDPALPNDPPRHRCLSGRLFPNTRAHVSSNTTKAR